MTRGQSRVRITPVMYINLMIMGRQKFGANPPYSKHITSGCYHAIRDLMLSYIDRHWTFVFERGLEQPKEITYRTCTREQWKFFYRDLREQAKDWNTNARNICLS